MFLLIKILILFCEHPFSDCHHTCDASLTVTLRAWSCDRDAAKAVTFPDPAGPVGQCGGLGALAANMKSIYSPVGHMAAVPATLCRPFELAPAPWPLLLPVPVSPL